MSPLSFTKVQGLGNDFLVVDLRARADSPEALAVQDPERVRQICDRHFGVGADGVLAVLPGLAGDARMRVLNADGSEAEMCGNGIRCVAKVLYESDPALRRPVLKIDTGAGLLSCEMNATDGRVESVTVEMGRPRFTRDELPLAPGGAGHALREPITALDRTFRFTAVSMGNPHAVIFVDAPASPTSPAAPTSPASPAASEEESLLALAQKYGPVLEAASTFPRRANIEFARVRRGAAGDEIDLVVWERGCGITLACGTGACATVVAAALEERLPRGREVAVHLPGGTLAITVAADDSGVRMRGPATTVFRSELDIGAIAGR